jgi:hypothetical protein
MTDDNTETTDETQEEDQETEEEQTDDGPADAALVARLRKEAAERRVTAKADEAPWRPPGAVSWLWR